MTYKLLPLQLEGGILVSKDNIETHVKKFNIAIGLGCMFQICWNMRGVVAYII